MPPTADQARRSPRLTTSRTAWRCVPTVASPGLRSPVPRPPASHRAPRAVPPSRRAGSPSAHHLDDGVGKAGRAERFHLAFTLVRDAAKGLNRAGTFERRSHHGRRFDGLPESRSRGREVAVRFVDPAEPDECVHPVSDALDPAWIETRDGFGVKPSRLGQLPLVQGDVAEPPQGRRQVGGAARAPGVRA